MPNIVSGEGEKRNQLPQIPKKKIPEFIRYVQTLSYPENRNPSRAAVQSGGNQYNVGMTSDVAVSVNKLPVKYLKPIQGEFNADKVKQMMQNIDSFKNDVFITDEDDKIFDGHHRWAALKQTNPNQQVRAIRVGIPIGDLVQAAHDFGGSFSKGISEIIKLKDLINKER